MMGQRRTWASGLGLVAVLSASLVVVALSLPACSSRAPNAAVDAARDRGTPDVYVSPDLGIDSARDMLSPDRYPGPCVAPRPDPVLGYSKIYETEYARHLFATPEGRTLIVTPHDVASVAATVTTTLTSDKENVMALYDGKELLVGDDAGRFRVFDDTLTLQRTFFMAANQLCERWVKLPGGLLLCTNEKLTSFVTYDLAAGKAVSTKDLAQYPFPLYGGPLVLVQDKYVAISSADSAYLYDLLPDYTLKLHCYRSFPDGIANFIGEELGGRLLLADGQIVKVMGTGCSAPNNNYFEPVGRFFTPKKDEWVKVIDAGTVFAGLAKMNGGRVALKIDRETHQIIGNPVGFGNLGAAYPYPMAYSAACDYLAFTHNEGAKRAVARLYF